MKFDGSAKDRSLTGIYEIYNTATGMKYVGQTQKSFEQRYKQHLSDLRCGHHCNQALQQAWVANGEDGFVFRIVERINAEDVDVLNKRERYYIGEAKKHRVAYNKTCGGAGHSACTRVTTQRVDDLLVQIRRLETENRCLREHIDDLHKDVAWWRDYSDMLVKKITIPPPAAPITVQAAKQQESSMFARIMRLLGRQ